MNDFPSIEEVHTILDDIAEELPTGFFDKLNQGIVLLPEYKLHPESRSDNDLYIMGQYVRSIAGRHIEIYYGSFEKVYNRVSIGTLREKLKATLLHEFTHHFESLAGEKGLEVKDAEDMRRYRERSRDWNFSIKI